MPAINGMFANTRTGVHATKLTGKVVSLWWSYEAIGFHAGGQAKDIEGKRLLDDVEKYTLASHLFWGLWGIISVCAASHIHFLNRSLPLLRCLKNYAMAWDRVLNVMHNCGYCFCLFFRNMWIKLTLTTWHMQGRGLNSTG